MRIQATKPLFAWDALEDVCLTPGEAAAAPLLRNHNPRRVPPAPGPLRNRQACGTGLADRTARR